MLPEDVSKCGIPSCILHADCWNNNMLYRYDEDKAVDMRLVDWQITMLGHPGRDISHFFFSSTSPEMRENHREELLSHYFATLSAALDKLGFCLREHGYTEEIFRAEMKRRYFFGLFIGLVILPIILDQSIVEKMDEMSQAPEAENIVKNTNPEEMFNEMKDLYTIDNLLTKSLLCHRIVALVEEIKNISQE